MYYVIEEVASVCIRECDSWEDAMALLAEEGLTGEESDRYLILSEEEYRELFQH